MGPKLSIDKHVSNLEDILELNIQLIDKVKFDNNIPDCITQHLKIWKFYEDKHSIKKVKSEPINLNQIQTDAFNFISNECYLVLLVYKKAHQELNQFTSFPHQMWGLVESYSNLTPRGLEDPVASSESYLESFLLPQRQLNPSTSNIFEYLIFVWNGKTANPLIKAQALSNAFELEHLLNKARDPLLEILFNGCTIKNKNLSKGLIVTFQSTAQTQTSNLISQTQIPQTIYLFNFLFSIPDKKQDFFKLADFIAKKQELPQDYTQQFIQMNLPYQISTNIQDSQIEIQKLYLRQSFNEAQPKDFTNIDESIRPRYNSNEVHDCSSPLILNSNIHFSISTENKGDENINSTQLISNKINLSGQLKNKVPTLNLPKLDLNCKTFSQEMSIEVPLIDVVENLENEKAIPMKLHFDNLKLQRDDTTYKDIEYEDSNGYNFDIRDTDRKKLKIQHFSEQCSSIIPEFLYVGGEQIAYNKEILKQIGVTHVINCAGDVCKNKFPNDFLYQTYYLKDSKTENIECIFYETINIIENAKKNNGKVLIHCVQGISRSVSICIAYLIISQQITYSQAFDRIKKNRGVASPNMGFTVQLLLFQKRLYAQYDSIPISPRVFAVGRGVSGHQSIVCRMLMEQLFSGKMLKTFDSRGVFLIQSEYEIFIWVGPECDQQEKFIQFALDYSNYLKQYEKAPQVQPILIKGNDEAQVFWNLWGIIGKPESVCKKIKEWDEWYNQIEEDEFNREKEENQLYYSSDRSDRNEEIYIEKKVFYLYPNSDEQLQIFDLEDLDQSQLIILLKEINNLTLQIFVWRGQEWIGNDHEEQIFVHDIISKYYSFISQTNIYVFQEEPNEESDVFLDSFS